MDSEDDMHDANDLESVDDDFYSGEAEDYYNSDNGDADDYEFIEDADDDSEAFAAHRHQVCRWIPCSSSPIGYVFSIAFSVRLLRLLCSIARFE